MSQKKILIIAGEPSGDLHASNLVRDLKRLDPGLSFYGLGGLELREAGADIIFDISHLALVGYIEVIRNIFVVGRAFHAVMSAVDKTRPDLAILVDYPGFNLRVARELKKRSIPIVYYISPQVWAWGADRINIIKKCVRKILVFFKFEEDLYRKHGIDAEFVGHPIVEVARADLSREEASRKFGLSAGKTSIALLPGSRKMEVTKLLPVMLSAGRILKDRGVDAQYTIARYPGLPVSLYEKALEGSSLDVRIVDGQTHNALGASDFAIVASGTATLEAAIIGTPFIVVYKTHPVTAFVARRVAGFRFLGLVNILAGKEVAPELLQDDATPEKIADGIIGLLGDDRALAAMRRELEVVKRSLGGPGASQRAAKAVYEIIRSI